MKKLFIGLTSLSLLAGCGDSDISDVKKADSSEVFTMAQANEILSAYSNSLLEKDKKKGEDFLAENKKKAGIQVTASGLQYEVITAGTGAVPTSTDMVRVHYHGTMIDGKVFDSSVERGQPAEFPVNGVIAGWTEALQLMPVGSKWKLYVPQELAYGPRGAGQAIPPYTALIFDVELLEILPAQAGE